MTARLILTSVCCLAFPACEKVKGIAEQAGGGASAVEVPSSSLDALVDHNAEGYLFRKDLPFPSVIKAESRTRIRMKQRGVTDSIFGKTPVKLDGTIAHRADGERRGNEATVQTYSPVFTETKAETAEKKDRFAFLSGEEKKPEPPKEPAPGQKVPFHLTKEGWGLAGDRMMTAKAPPSARVDPHHELATLGLVERRFWFGAKRLKIGDQVTLSGDQLQMVTSAKGSGTLIIRLEGIEKIDGHPCGVFSMSGDYDLKVATGGDDSLSSKTSLTSGRIWLSLLYPLVLKQELEGVMSEKIGPSGGPGSRTQGTAEVSTEYDWKPVVP